MPLAVGRPQTITCAATNNHMHSYKSPAGRLESHQRGFRIETLLLCPGDLLSKSSKLSFFQKNVVGVQPPVNDRRVGGKHNTVKQAGSGFGGRCLRKSSKAPLRPNSPLPVGPLNQMTFAMGGTPRAGSQEAMSYLDTIFKVPLSGGGLIRFHRH